MTGDPDKEYRTNKPPPTRRVRERSKGDTECPSTSQNPPRQHPSWLSDACATREDSELEWLAKDHPETNPITIKPDIESHVAEQFSWVPFCGWSLWWWDSSPYVIPSSSSGSTPLLIPAWCPGSYQDRDTLWWCFCQVIFSYYDGVLGRHGYRLF